MSLATPEITVDGFTCPELVVLSNLFNTDGKFVEEWKTETGKTVQG